MYKNFRDLWSEFCPLNQILSLVINYSKGIFVLMAFSISPAHARRLYGNSFGNGWNRLFLFHQMSQVLDHYSLSIRALCTQISKDGLQPRLIRTNTDIYRPIAPVGQMADQGSQLFTDLGRFGVDKRRQSNSIGALCRADITFHAFITHPAQSDLWLRFDWLQQRRDNLMVKTLNGRQVH